MRDVFIATHMAWRDELAEDAVVWAQEIRTCKAKWRALFHPYEAHNGGNLSDYLSRNVTDVRRLA